MDRQHRHDLKHDKFVDEIGALSSKALENQRLILSIVGAIVVIALVVSGIVFYRNTQEKKAQAALAMAIEAIESPLLPEKPAPGQQVPPNAKYKTEAERTAAAEKLFKEVQTKYPGSDAADVSGFYVGRIAAARGNVKKPAKIDIKWLEESLEGSKAKVAAKVNMDKKNAVLQFSLLWNEGRWRVYDLAIDDVSTVRTYRTQFRKLISEKGWAIWPLIPFDYKTAVANLPERMRSGRAASIRALIGSGAEVIARVGVSSRMLEIAMQLEEIALEAGGFRGRGRELRLRDDALRAAVDGVVVLESDGELREIRGAPGILRVLQHPRRRLRRPVHVVVHDVTHEALDRGGHRHEVDREASNVLPVCRELVLSPEHRMSIEQ